MSKWATLRDRIKNTPGLGRDVGFVVAVLVAGALVAGYLLSNYHIASPTAERTEFSAEFDKAPALQLAARQEVRIAGVDVGEITDAEVTDQGRALLTMAIDPEHEVYSNARLVVRSKNPLNVMYVALDPGGPPGKPLERGDVIPVAQTERVTQSFELLDELDGRARAALTDLVMQADAALADAPRDLPAGLTAADHAADSFQPVVAALRTRRENLEHLVTSVSNISTAAGQDDVRLTSLADSLATTLDVVAANDEELSASLDRLPGMTRTLRGSMRSAAVLSDELSPTLRSLHAASGELPGALERLTGTVINARDTLRAAGPVARKARPFVADLRPLVSDLRGTLADLSPVVSTLPGATRKIVPWLDHLGAFIYNTSSSFSLGDVNGGIGRANIVVKSTDPTGGGLS
jgi:phospholipid/cholesterol/gamma-HCH transport system substrate-binding protein